MERLKHFTTDYQINQKWGRIFVYSVFLLTAENFVFYMLITGLWTGFHSIQSEHHFP